MRASARSKRGSGRQNMLRKTAMGLSVLIVVLLAVGLGVYIYLRSSLPQTSGSIELTGLNKSVEIIRDSNAVPHIFAETAEDAYFALGYVHAQDRLWQMEFTRHACNAPASRRTGRLTGRARGAVVGLR